MSRTSEPRSEFRFPWRTRRQLADDLEEELAFHLERKAEELMASGMDAHEARREAANRFGDLDYTKRYCSLLIFYKRWKRSATA